MKATINLFGELHKITIKEHRYTDNGNIALQAYSEGGEPFGKITVNTDSLFPQGCVLVKTYSENAAWVPQLLEQLPNNFRRTGVSVPLGFTSAEVWEYFPESVNN